MVFQDLALWPHLSALENVTFGLRRNGAGSDSVRQRALATMDMMGIADLADRGSHQLSGGQRQRLALARALAPGNSVLLLDEPFSNLDPLIKQSLLDSLRRIRDRADTAILYVTHGLDEALAVAHRILLLKDGRIGASLGRAEIGAMSLEELGQWYRTFARRLGTALSVMLLSAALCLWAQPARTADYVTWDTMEPDKCALIWLIRTHVDPDARFVFVPSDAELSPGIPFDVPDARVRRTQNQSAFEVLAQRDQLVGPRIDYIGRLMHDIEINTWGRKALRDTQAVQAEILAVIDGLTAADAVVRCVGFFDQLPLPKSRPGEAGTKKG